MLISGLLMKVRDNSLGTVLNSRSLTRNLAIGFIILLGLNAVGADDVKPSVAPTASEYPELAGLAKVYFVSPSGDDQNLGSADAPFRTISRAAKILHPGEGVFVRAGTYRERVSSERGGISGKPIVFFAEPGHQVFLKGSDVWQPLWSRAGTRIYSATPDEAMFTDDAYWDSANPLRVTVSATPWGREGRAEFEYFTATNKNNARDRMSKTELEKLLAKCDTNLVFTLGQLFVDGKMFHQMPDRSELEAVRESWCYDSKSGQIFVHFADERSPEQHQVELTTRRRIFAPHKQGLGYIHVIGFVMEHCGNQYPKDFWSTRENGQAGALGTRAGHHWLIRNNVLRFANGFGLDIGSEGVSNERNTEQAALGQPAGFHVIKDNRITENGAGGICGILPRSVTIVNNVIERNNNLQFKGTKRWESAGIKLHRPDDSLVADNLFRDNYTHGFWADQGIGKGLQFTRNIIIGNAESEHGVFIEMGEYAPDTGFINNNIIVGNRNGIYCHDGSGMTVAHNLIANSREYGIQVRQVGPRCNTRNNAFFNNLLIGNEAAINLNYPAELGGGVRLDGNVYSGNESDRVFVINPYSKFNPSWTAAEFTKLLQSSLGTTILDKSAVNESGLPTFTFRDWKTFWSKHSQASDQHGKLTPGSTVKLEAETLLLTLFVPGDLSGSDNPETVRVTKDFFGQSFSNSVRVGPFAGLVQGTNQIQLPMFGRSANVAVKVSINTTSPGAVIPTDFSGLSFEVAQLLPDAAGVYYFRPDNLPLIQMFRTLGIRSLRIGGNTSDRDAKKLPGPADWEAFFAFARAADVKVIYGLQLHKGDPQVAAQTVKHLMDRYAPLIDSFAIGQEPSAYSVGAVDDRPQDERMGPGAENFRYQKFALEWKRFADAIRAVVPNVRFSGPDVHNDGKWTSQFINDFGRSSPISLVTAHLYVGGAGNKVVSPQIGREEMLSVRFLRTYQSLHASFAPLADARNLPYRLNEVNSFYNAGAAGVSDTFAATLWGLDFMHWWAKNGTAGLNFHTGDQVAAGPILQPARYAIFLSCPDGYQARPLAYALKAFQLGGVGKVLPLTITSPQPINLTAYATMDENETVYVTLINKEHGAHARDGVVSLQSTGGRFCDGQIIHLKSSPLGVAATSGVTLGGAEISTTGDFASEWMALPSSTDGVNVRTASAVIVKYSIRTEAGLNAGQ
jgi:hypothetical protein